MRRNAALPHSQLDVLVHGYTIGLLNHPSLLASTQHLLQDHVDFPESLVAARFRASGEKGFRHG